jgi:hypothetical protein
MYQPPNCVMFWAMPTGPQEVHKFSLVSPLPYWNLFSICRLPVVFIFSMLNFIMDMIITLPEVVILLCLSQACSFNGREE